MKKIALLSVLFIFAFSCKNSNSIDPSNINDFSDYIATYTRGNIPTKSEITIVLKTALPAVVPIPPAKPVVFE